MIDAGEADTGTRFIACNRLELDIEDAGQIGLFVKKIDQPAANATNGGHGDFARIERLFKILRTHGNGARMGLRRIVHDEPHCIGCGAVNGIGRACKAARIGIDDEIDVTLPVERHFFRTMPASEPEAQRADSGHQSLCIFGMGGKLDKADPVHLCAGRHGGDRQPVVRLDPANLIAKIDQRTASVGSDHGGRSATELVVEDFQREIAVIAGRGHRAHEIQHRQVALARHVAIMAAPVKQVHVDQRRIRHLDNEKLVLRNGADRIHVDLARQRVKTVEDQPDIGMVGAAHDLPCIAVVADMAAPGERLVTDAQIAPRRPLAKLAKIIRGAVNAANGSWRHVGADQNEIGAQLLHQVELAFGAVESAAA